MSNETKKTYSTFVVNLVPDAEYALPSAGTVVPWFTVHPGMDGGDRFRVKYQQ